MNPMSRRLSLIYQKNQHLLDSLILRKAPRFVYQSDQEPIDGHIPVFTFHTAIPEWFEAQCQHVAENGYHALSADEFHAGLSSKRQATKKSVFITFDDGLKHVWTVAFPLLKKYGLKATCFLITGCIPDDDHRVRPTLEDYWKGEATLTDVLCMSPTEEALATWDEIKIMHESGVIDFQSHTMYHSLVFTENRVFDFVHPAFNPYFYGNIFVPMYTKSGQDVVSRDPLLGMPIYQGQPRMIAKSRFFDDEDLRSACISTVQNEGGHEFFKGKDWRKKLEQVMETYKRQHKTFERYETPEERESSLVNELRESRVIIEERLKGKKVNQLCYPFYEGDDVSIRASQMAGFDVNHFGQRKGRVVNRPGDDPFNVVRVEDIFLRRLPGSGRQSLVDLMKDFWNMRKLPVEVGLG